MPCTSLWASKGVPMPCTSPWAPRGAPTLTLLLAVQTKVTSAPGFTRCTRFSSTVTVMALPGVSVPRQESSAPLPPHSACPLGDRDPPVTMTSARLALLCRRLRQEQM